MFIEILFKIVLFKGGVLIYAEHCIYCFFEYTVPIATSFLLELIYAGLSLCLPTKKGCALELLEEEKEGL